MNTRIARWSGVMAAALLAVGCAGRAGAARWWSRHGHGHGGGFAIERVLASLKGQLSLNTSQQLMWDNAVAQTKAARATGRTNFESVRSGAQRRAREARARLRRGAAAAMPRQASNQTLRKQVRDQWLQLYATFSPAQEGRRP
jgi:hypothetical protein